VGIEMIRLFQVELEHYEKIEGAVLSLDGKANRLATLIRNNLGAALQGLAVIPLFAGYDLDAADSAKAGRIFSFDVAGGVYEETGFDGIGSGSLFAKAALKKRYRPGLSTTEAVVLAIEALYDAADDDTATGGPDLTRRIFPVVTTATAEGTRRLPDAETAEVTEAVVARRMENPGG
jgi:proteasome beta subunit